MIYSELNIKLTYHCYKYYSKTTEIVTDGDFTEKKTYSGYTKYVISSDYGYKGLVDKKKTLDGDDDIACVKWGGKWRTPTSTEMNELIRECTSAQGYLDGTLGYKVTGPNGNWIFFPIAGFCNGSASEYPTGGIGGWLNPGGGWEYRPSLWQTDSSARYWTSSTEYSSKAACAWISENYSSVGDDHRYIGLQVRPVRSK